MPGGVGSSRHEKIATAAHIVQIFALLVAGFWGLLLWWQQVLPLLASNVDVTSSAEVAWHEAAGACIGNFSIRLENFGSRQVEISKVEYKIIKHILPKLDDAQFMIANSISTELERTGTIALLEG